METFSVNNNHIPDAICPDKSLIISNGNCFGIMSFATIAGFEEALLVCEIENKWPNNSIKV